MDLLCDLVSTTRNTCHIELACVLNIALALLSFAGIVITPSQEHVGAFSRFLQCLPVLIGLGCNLPLEV